MIRRLNAMVGGFSLFLIVFNGLAQDAPTGNPKDFRLKTCLHSVSYAGVWRGHIAYEMCEVLDGGGSVANLDKTARKFLEYMKPWRTAP